MYTIMVIYRVAKCMQHSIIMLSGHNLHRTAWPMVHDIIDFMDGYNYCIWACISYILCMMLVEPMGDVQCMFGA